MDKDTYIKVRLPEEIKIEIEVRAKSMGMTMAAYLRFLATKDVAVQDQKASLFVIENLEGIVKELNRLRLRRSLQNLKR